MTGHTRNPVRGGIGAQGELRTQAMTNISFQRDENDLPLIVDLDRTLLRTDTLIEQFLILFLAAPPKALSALRTLGRGKAAFKEAVIDLSPVSPDALVLNEELLDYLLEQREKGRPLHLITAADQRVADAVAQKVGIFDKVIGSSDGHNLKGANKRDYLLEHFPDGFSYAGDSPSDLDVWREARSAVLVGVNGATRRAVHAMDRHVEKDIPRPHAGARAWLRLFRVHQWSKNILVFVALILSQQYGNLDAWLASLGGFLSMCLIASGTYIVNDIADIESDRQHRSKKFRPIASGHIDAGLGLLVSAILIAAGLALGALTAFPALPLFGLYLLTTLAYSLALKRIVLVDVFLLAILYTLRIMVGVLLVDGPVPHWLIMFSLFFFFSLSLAKRHVEIVTAAAAGDAPQTAIKGRGYRVGDAPFTLTLGIATNMVAILVLGLYVASDIYPAENYGHPVWLWGIVSMVMIWSSRIWLLSHRGELDDDPVSFAMRDRTSGLIGLLTAIFFVLSII